MAFSEGYFIIIGKRFRLFFAGFKVGLTA